MIHDTQSTQMSQKQDGCNIYVIMKTMCSPGYHHNGLVATHALGHMMSHDALMVTYIYYIYIYTYIYIYIYIYIKQNNKIINNINIYISSLI